MTKYSLSIGEQNFDVEIITILGDTAHVTVNQTPYEVLISGVSTPQATPVPPPTAAPAVPSFQALQAAAPSKAAPVAGGSGAVTAPIPGKVLSLLVKTGDSVTAGQVVAIVEAMKMENNLVSPINGKVKEIRVTKDSDVSTGDVIMVIG